jgi:hypothetical protein
MYDVSLQHSIYFEHVIIIFLASTGTVDDLCCRRVWGRVHKDSLFGDFGKRLFTLLFDHVASGDFRTQAVQFQDE